MNPSDVRFAGQAHKVPNSTLIDFWQWAFSDLCDDDIKGIFAEWMVRTLLGLPSISTRRVSWADSDIILANGTRIEVKSTALWQSWKLVNEDGTQKPCPAPASLNPSHVRFGGLQARTAVSPAKPGDAIQFKSSVYIFCFQSETDPAAWDAWNLDQWEFYMMSQQELVDLKIGDSVSLATLRKARPAMSAEQFQSYAKPRLGLFETSEDPPAARRAGAGND
jgi:hypothetical protein